MMNVAICIPVCNPGSKFDQLIASIVAQTRPISGVLIMDSSPIRKVEVPGSGFRVVKVDPAAFDHGGTRRLAVELTPAADILVFLTQDAVLADPEALSLLAASLNDAQVGAAFGRQLPDTRADAMQRHARCFNYPSQSMIKSQRDIPRLGLKTAFISNSFAAYRLTALQQVGGFPERCIVSEDTHVAARMLLAGWKIAYCAQARVVHSHAYSLQQEFRRYFDIGVFHARHRWIRDTFGRAEGEGTRFVASELKFVARHDPLRIPSSLVRTPVKYFGFRLGLLERLLPLAIRRRLSMQKIFWRAEATRGKRQPSRSAARQRRTAC